MVPQTQRLLIFKEQVESVFRKLIDPLMSVGEIDHKIHILRRTMDEKVSFEMFKKWLLTEYKDLLSENDQEGIYLALWWAFDYLHEYCHYSTTLSRLEAKYGVDLSFLSREDILEFIENQQCQFE